MLVKELIEALRKLPQDLVVGSVGHYGELDWELDGVSVKKNEQAWRSERKEPSYFVVLEGMPASYEEPD